MQRIETLYEYNSNMLESVRSGAFLCSECTAIPPQDSIQLFIDDDDDMSEEDCVVVQRASAALVSTAVPSGGTITKHVKAFNRHSLQQTNCMKVKSTSINNTAATLLLLSISIY